MGKSLDMEMVSRYVRESAEVCVSTTSSDGYPVTRVMFNLHNPDQYPKQAAFLSGLSGEFCIYLCTNAASAKVADMIRSPKVSAYYHATGSWQGLLVVGEVEMVRDPLIRRGLWQKEWSMYYEGGVDGDDFTVIRLCPVKVEYYHDLTKEVLELADD